MRNHKITVFAIHRPFRAPNEKYRWMQFANHLPPKWQTEYLYLLNECDDKVLLQSKNILLKVFIFIKTFFKRLWQIITLKNTDTIIIYRELHWFHCPLLTYILKKKCRHLVYDFDDAIFLPIQNPFIHLIKQPSAKTKHFIKKAHVTIVGNHYLQSFAEQYSQKVILIPTVVDTNYFIPLHHLRHKPHKITIGWMGSHSTIPHLLSIAEVLNTLREKYPIVELKVVGKKMYLPELKIYTEEWKLENEVTTLNTFDIGIMPLPNDEWSKGKCGLKMLTYLACEIPCIASNIGVSAEIIEKTKGGLLANNPQEWLNALSTLIENKEKRIQLGRQGRIGVIKHYSVERWKNIFINALYT